MAGHGRLALLVGSAMVIGGAIASVPVTDVALVTAHEDFCAAVSRCPADPAPDGGDQATAERRVIDGYVSKQAGCTPDMTASPQSVTWDPPGFTPNTGGSGNITDANPQLGGHFVADYVNGRWHIDYQYC
ncbi:MAG: integrase [Mycobacterium sp.]|nr:MAG: integrase [Mycobacterium sp.]